MKNANFTSTSICLVLLLQFGNIDGLKKFQEHFSWSIIEYAYDNDIIRNNALLTGNFIPANNLPVGIEIWNDKLFVTVPRWRQGIPSTLNYVPINSPVKNPELIPYPDWSSNELGNCENGLATVYRIKADACDRLWVLDTGTFGIENTTQNVCPYAINVFDLRTNKRIHRYVLRNEDINANTFIANIAVELVGNSCDDAFAYLSDELGYGLIVYSWKMNKSWRFSHSYFMPDPLAGDFNIDGLNFQWGQEGIFGMALSPKTVLGDRSLYFSPLASNRQFAVSTNILRNISKVDDSYRDFQVLSDRGPYSHTTARVMDETGIELYNLIDQNAVGCWNSVYPHHPSYLDVVDSDEKALIFPSDVKVDHQRNVWVMSDKMSTFLLSNLDYTKINFRVVVAPLSFLVKDTVCDIRNVKPYSFALRNPGLLSNNFLKSINLYSL